MNSRRWLAFSALSLVALSLLVVALTPSLRRSAQKLLPAAEREILATAEGDLLGEHRPAKVIKLRDGESIFVEVFRVGEDGSTELVERLILPDKHDGLFNFQGHVTRLAIADVDGDGKLELLAPSFDNQLVPHLNVFRYNAAGKRFEPVGSGPEPK